MLISQEHIAICVCTYLRPAMLADCLRSLTAQTCPSDCAISIVIIDNDSAGSARPVVADCTAVSPWPVHYRIERRRGIAFARNAARDAATEFAPDWVFFFDDDQIAGPDCVVEALAAARRFDADVVSCRFPPVFPDPAPF